MNLLEDIEDCYNNATRCIFPSIEAKRELQSYYGFCAVDKRGKLEPCDKQHLKYRVNTSKLCWEQDD